MDSRASLFIDIEGFGQLYAHEDADSLWGLSDLMDAIYQLGTACGDIGVARIYAHQFGDGFLLIQDTNTRVGPLVSCAVAIHQYVLIRAGHFCASAIELGELADVIGCYPESVVEGLDGSSSLALGDGVMTITPVMGSAIIRTYGLLKKIRGAVLALPKEYLSDLDEGIITTENNGLLYVNWLASNNPTITAAKRVLNISNRDESELRRLLDSALKRNKPHKHWIDETLRYLKAKKLS